MSTYRIKGDDGVIIDSTKYLELPKGTDNGRPAKARPGMIRYNADDRHRGIEASVIVETAGTKSLEWRRVAHLDADGKLLTSQLPSSITGSLVYKGTWDAAINDVNETAADTSLTDRLPTAVGHTGWYYIVRADGDGGEAAGHPANDLAPVNAADVPRYRKGDWIVSNGAKWEKVDQSQITSTASQVQVTVNPNMRDKHSVRGAVSLQDLLDGFVETALDRTGDEITGIIKVVGASNRARILLADGSAAEPNLSFTGNTNLGLYRVGTNTMGFSANGAVKLELNASLLKSYVTMQTIDGDAGTPSYSFTDSKTAGMYKAAANVIGFSTSGTERARIHDKGIKTLVVTTNRGSTTEVAYGFDADLSTGMYSPSAGQVSISANNTQTLVFKKTEVESKLQIKSTYAGTKTAPAYSFSDGKTGMYSSTAGILSFSSNDSNTLVMSSTLATLSIPVKAVKGTTTTAAIYFEDDANTGFIHPDTGKIDIISGGSTVLSLSSGSVLVSSAQTLIQKGTVSAPGLAFNDDKDTGIYWVASKTLGLAAGGKVGLSIDSAQKVTVAKTLSAPLGTAAAPSIIFNNQSAVGIFGETGKVGLASTGVQLSVDANGVTVAKKLNVPAGSSSAPTLLFGSSTTGLYAPNANQLGVAISGTAKVLVTSDSLTVKDQLRLKEGTAASPSVAFEGHTNTGFYRKTLTPDAENITFVANGVESLQVLSDYVSPLKPLKLIAGTSAAPALCFGDDTASGIYYAGDTMHFSVAGTDMLTVSGTGIGIGATVNLDDKTLAMGTGNTIKTTSNTMAFKATHATAPFTFGKATSVYMVVAPGGIIVPSGTDAGRPAAPTNGTIRYSTTINNFEGYINGRWAKLSGSGEIEVSGTAAAPALTMGSDKTTGIYSSANGVINFSTGGAEQMKITSSNTTFNKPIIIATATGSITIGSTNSTYIEFNGDRASHFNQLVEAKSFKVDGKDTYLQEDGKIKELGTLLEDKYVVLADTTAKNIKMIKASKMYWSHDSGSAAVGFKNDSASDADPYMYFETGDSDTRYFKFRNKASSGGTPSDWMTIKSGGVTVSGTSNKLGDWTISSSGLSYNGTNVIAIASDGSVTLNGSSSSSGGVSTSGDTMTGTLNFTNTGNVISTVGGYIRSNNAQVMAMDGKVYSFVTSPKDAHLCYNSYWDGTNWRKYENSSSSGYVVVNADGLKYYTSGVGDTSPQTNSYNIYHTGNKPTLAELGAAAASHTHPISQLTGVAAASHRHAFADLDGVAAASHSHTATSLGDAAANANTLALRDGAADVHGRLFRATYIDQGDISGAIAFRVNNSSDNYTRYCNNPAAIRTFIGAFPTTGGALSGNISVTGTIYASGDITAFSDARLKKNVLPLTGALDAVMKLRSVQYVMKSDKLEQVKCGFIAQEVREVIPEVVVELDDEDKTLSVDYSKITAYLVEAMQEQQRLIEELRLEIEKLKSK